MSSSGTYATYEEVVEKDLTLMWATLNAIEARPRIENFLYKITSKHPWQDICSIPWLFFIGGCFEYKSKHFWPVAINLAVSFLLRQIIQSKRPLEYDIRLKPMTDTAADSYGFPSLETHMCIVIMFDLYYLSHSRLIFAAGIILTILVGFSRIFSRSRFPHQIVASVLTGMLGLSLSYQCCSKMGFHIMSKHRHGVWLSFVVAAVLCYFAMAIESNDSRLMNIPKTEFIRVLRGIAFPDQQPAQSQSSQRADNVSSTPRSPKSPLHKVNTPRSTAIKQAIAAASRLSANARMRGDNKSANKDSFYFLQRTLEKREEEKKLLSQQIRLSNATAFGDAVKSNYFRRIVNERDEDMTMMSSSDSEYATGGKAT